jgi:cytochrome oxidase Cu insertion factor (SCO1/SenC/PrrC family)
LSLAWVTFREWQPPGAGAGRGDPATVGTGPAEPAWRQVLRVGFGLLWVFDGILQAQPAMAVGLPSKVIEPIAASSPRWVQHLVNWAGTTWSYHPVQAGAAAVWIQIGIGLWLLFAARGSLSRLAGLASAGWAVVVWVFGESFGGIFAPGLSWLTGAPGAAAFYCVAGALVALPVRCWRGRALGRLMAGGTAVFLAGMAVLQAWPGRGYWQGSVRGQAGPLASMAGAMAGTPQPAALSDLVSGFGGFVRAHGFAVNLLVVTVLGLLAAAFAVAAVTGGAPARGTAPGGASARLLPWLTRGPVILLAALCLADWVLVQDFGFFGGLGTDPNSMIPVGLLAAAAYLALARAPATAAMPAGETAGGEGPQRQPGPAWRRRLSAVQVRPAALSRSLGAASLRTVLSASAVGVIILGAIPMAAAQASSTASPVLADAIGGSSAPLNSPAPGFALTDQDGRHVTLASLRGKAVLLTFLDPVCVTDCPLIAQEFRQAGILLAADAGRVELVAVNLSPLYSSLAYTRAFDRQEQLAGVRNWLFLTGSPAQLGPVWRRYGLASQTAPAGAMLLHSDTAFVIGPSGRLREELNFDPGPGTAATKASWAARLADAGRQALAAS